MKQIYKLIFPLLLLLSTALQARDLFWIGGTGNWNDQSHWSYSSGGPAANVLPTIADDVIFDRNSFQGEGSRKVMIDQATLKSILIKDGAYPEITGGSGATLKAAGDVQLSGARSSFEGTVYLTGTGRQLVALPLLMDADVVIEGSDVQLSSPLAVSAKKSISFVSGSFNSKGLQVQAGRLQVGDNAKKVSFKGSKVFVTEGTIAGNTSVVEGEAMRTRACVVDSVVVRSQSLKCNRSNGGTCDGSIRVKIYGAGCSTTVFQYEWLRPTGDTIYTGPDSTALLNLCPGAFTLLITDAATGEFVGNPNIQITEAFALTANYSKTQPTCFGDCNGQLRAIPGGGAGNGNPSLYTYLWMPVNRTTQTISNICAGTYTLTLTDTSGCVGNFVTDLTQPPPIVANPSKTNVTCFGFCNGTAAVAPTGGTLTTGSTYTYSWNTTPTQSTPSISGLCPGNYVVTITDSKGCIRQDTTIITQPDSLRLTRNRNNVSCGGASDGLASICPVSGGTPTYTYVWTGSTSTGCSASGLGPGVYSVTVTDLNGCNKTATFTITEPDTLRANVTGTNIKCFGLNDGTVTSTPTGGTGPFTFNWSTGATASGTSSTITNLVAGTYSVSVTDANGCTATGSITLTEPQILAATVSPTNILCAGSCTGAATVSASGGTGTYTYTWSTGQTNVTSISNLCAGTYSVTVRDENLCIRNVTYTITEPPPLAVVVKDTTISCAGLCNASLSGTVTGGTGSPSYLWSSLPAGFSSTSNPATGLCVGTYVLQVTDGNGCIARDTASVSNPTTITATLATVNPSCFGSCDGRVTVTASGGQSPYTYSVDGGAFVTTSIINGLCANPSPHTVVIRDALGCSITRTFTLTQPAPITSTDNTTNLLCFNQCQGVSTLTISGGTSPYNVLWVNTPTLQTGVTADSLCAGTYIAEITDFRNCRIYDTVIVQQPNLLLPDATSNNASCFGSCNGTASVTVSGGTPPFTYSWNTTPIQTTSTITGLCPRSYIVTVTDSAGCTGRDTVIVTQPNQLTAQVTQVGASCETVCDGRATVTAGGGTRPYTYLWSDPKAQKDSTATGLCIGTFTVTVTDAKGCTTSASVNVPPVVQITINTTGTNISCAGGNNGGATASASGGLQPYTYFWSPVNVSGPSVTGLSAGTYIVTATDANGCSSRDTVILTDPPKLTVNATGTDASCGSLCDGTATAVKTGGTGTVSFEWSNGPSGATISGLCAGTYTVTATDANGCTAVDSVVIEAPVAITASAVINEATCGSSDGSISVSPSGGTAPYSVFWTPPVSSSANPLTNIPAGIYYAVVTDAFACSDTFTFAVSNINGPDVTLADSAITCAGQCNGKLFATATGGTEPYTYTWSTGATGVPSITNLCAGEYTLTVGDANNCLTIIIDTLVTPPPIVIYANVTNVTCSGSCNGAIAVTPTGGTGNYTYLWAGSGAVTPSITGLCVGSYIVTVTDSLNCAVTDTFAISPATVISANENIQNVSCFGRCDASIILNPSGGVAPLTFLWSNGSTEPSLTNICAGSYSVTITDAVGCSITRDFIITTPPAIIASVAASNPSCFGLCNGTAIATVSGGTGNFNYFWTGGGTNDTITGLCAGDYTMIVSEASLPSCSVSVSISLVSPPAITVTASGTNIICANTCSGTLTSSASGGSGPLSYTWAPGPLSGPSHSNVCADTYQLTVADTNGCTAGATVTLTAPPALFVTGTRTNVKCAGLCTGSATVNTSGGTPPYSFLWSNGSTTSTISNLCAGNYTVTVTDSAGCSDDRIFNISEPEKISATYTLSYPKCGVCDGIAIVLPTGGSGAQYSYLWNTGSTAASIVNVCAGIYNVTVTDTANCSASFDIPLENQNAPVTSHVKNDVRCFGDSTGNATVSISSGTPPFTIGWTPGSFSSLTVNTLWADTFNVQVTDSLGCIGIETIVINQPEEIDPNDSIINASCAGSCNGEIHLMPTGGSPGYSYAWTPSTLPATASVTGLCAGFYSVVITDQQNCTASDTFNVASPAPLVVVKDSSNISCNGFNDGVASITISGGTSPYTVTWSNSPTPTVTIGTSIISGLSAGTYTASVVDSRNCSSVVTFNITQPLPLAANDSIVNVRCSGNCDGQIILRPSGGTPSYSASWSNGASGLSIGNLCPGVYGYTLTDARGCNVTRSVTITEPPVLSASMSSNNVSCNSSCNGSATITPGGGTAPYFYLWSNQRTTQTITGLCPGTYSVTVTDAKGCTFTASANITEPQPVVPNFSITQPLCGVCDGVITAAPTGGSGGPYTFLWSNGSVSSTISGLCAGLYTVDVTDAGGCKTTFTAPLSNSNGPGVATAVKQPTCAGKCDGFIAITPSGANGPFTFSWSPGGSTNDTIQNLCPGNYYGIVTDALGCITISSDTLTNSSVLTVASTVTGSKCGACDGSALVSVLGGAVPYTIYWSNGDTDTAATGLCAGVYTVQATDNVGCVVQENVSVSNTAGPTGEQLVTTDETCFGASNGSATITAVGGTPPYNYIWVPGGQTTNSITGLASGEYSVEMRDATGCIRVTDVLISAPEDLKIEAFVVNATCGTNDGAITITATGGCGGYTYSWNTGANSPSLSGIIPGLYQVTVSDNCGCSKTETIAVATTNAPLVTISATDISCFGSCNGSAVVTATGGAGSGYSFQWSTGSTSGTISNLCKGKYVVLVQDANNCFGSATTEIQEPAQLALSLPNVVDATCAGSCNGTASAIASGGVLPYSFNWSNGQNTSTADSLCEGSHTITITDANGCSISQGINIEQNPTLTASYISTNSACGECAGTANVVASGGVEPYAYTWANGSTTDAVTELCAGVHPVTITDSAGCTYVLSIGISNTEGPVSNLTGVNESCFGTQDASITSTVTGNATPFTYTWFPGGESTQNLSGITAGFYLLEVADTNGCKDVDTITISAPSEIEIQTIIKSPTCGNSDGTLSAIVSGGVPPYTVSWSNGATGTTITNIFAGVFTATITDATGCQKVIDVPVSNSNAPVISLAVTNISCSASCDGAITSTVSGTGTYNYAWNTTPVQTTPDLTGICGGTYVLTVTDPATNCVAAAAATVIQTKPLVAGQPYTKDASCGGTCNGVATVLPAGGTMPYSYSWSSGGATTQSSSTLCVGTYTVTITDRNNCTVASTFEISEPPPIVIDTTGGVNHPFCSNGTDGAINVSVTGGAGAYTFSWSGSSTASTEDLANVGPGSYTLLVTDQSGCSDTVTVDLVPQVTVEAFAGNDTSACEGAGGVILRASGGTTYQWFQMATPSAIGTADTIAVNPGVGVTAYVLQSTNVTCSAYDTVLVTIKPKPVVDAGTDTSIVRGATVTIGGSPTAASGSTFQWAPSEGLTGSTLSNPGASPDQSTMYVVTATLDGCSASDSVEVRVLPNIVVPDGISPNGDGANDEWIIDNIELFPNCIVEVYNRWGEMLFHSEGYIEKFKGQYNGKDLPVGTYYYIIDLRDERYQPYTGPITVVR